MKKRKFEDGGPTNDGIVRKRGLRREGTNELVLDSRGMPILTVGEEDQDTKDAIAKAEAMMGAQSAPLTKRRGFLSRLFGPRKRSLLEEYDLEKQNREDETSFVEREVENEKKRRPIVRAPFAPRDSNLKKGGSVTRGDGIAKRGKTKGRYI